MTAEGDKLIADEIAAARASDPPPADIPLGDGPKKRGRPFGSKNGTTAGRRTRSSKLDEIESAFATSIERGALLATYMLSMAPMPSERKVVWMEDATIVSSDDGKKALTGSLRFACERNAKIERFCLRAIEASAYTGIGATVLFGLVLPIAMNHGLIKVPDTLRGMIPTAPPIETPEAETVA